MAGTFEATNVSFKESFKFTNKQKRDVQRQLLLAAQRRDAVEHLRPATEDEPLAKRRRKRRSYLAEVKPILVRV